MVSWEDVKEGDIVLITDWMLSINIYEVQIVGFSPSKKYAKVRYIPSNKYEWIDTEKYKVLEVL